MDEKLRISLASFFEEEAEKKEKNVDDIEKIFDKIYEKVSTSPSMAGKSPLRVVKRCKSKLQAHFRNTRGRGDKVVFIPFGILGNPKDWNAKEMKLIRDMANLDKINELIAAEQVVTMKDIKGNVVAVTEVKEWGKKEVYIIGDDVFHDPKDGAQKITEFYVKEGIPIKANETNVIPREYRKQTNFGGVEFKWSQRMLPKYNAKLTGIAYIVGDEENVKMCEINLRGDVANPQNFNFVINNLEMFRPYVMEFKVNEKVKGIYSLSYYGEFVPKNTQIPNVSDNNIDDVIEVNLEEIKKTYPDIFVPPIVFLDDIKKTHESFCLRDGKNVIKKSKKGYDLTDWDKYGIIIADLINQKRVGKSKNFLQYTLGDGDVEFPVRCWGSKWLLNSKGIAEETPVMGLFTTSRNLYRYDFATKDNILDEENADISVTINSIKALPRITDIEIDFEDEEE